MCLNLDIKSKQTSDYLKNLKFKKEVGIATIKSDETSSCVTYRPIATYQQDFIPTLAALYVASNRI